MKGDWCQFLAGDLVLMSIPQFLAGFFITWNSYTALLLESQDSPLSESVTPEQLDVVASCPLLGAVLGSIVACHLAVLLGRKNCELLAGLMLTLSWSLIATATSVNQLTFARFLGGSALGMHIIVCVVYNNEIEHPFIRRNLPCIPIFFYSFGCLTSYTMGWLCSYQFIVYFNLVSSVMFTCLIYFLKKSPLYLLMEGNDKKSINSCNGSKSAAVVLEELEYYKKPQNESPYVNTDVSKADEIVNLNGTTKQEIKVTDSSALKILFSSEASLRTLITTTSVHTLSMLSIMVIQTHAGQLFSAVAPGFSPHLCSVVLAAFMVVGNGIAVLISDLVPRRMLLISSCAICTSCLGALSTMMRWEWAPSWAALLLILLHCCAFIAGANIPMVQLSESFMPEVKTFATVIFLICSLGSNFLALLFFGPCLVHIGLDGTFFVFFLIALVATGLSFFLIKETRGLSS